MKVPLTISIEADDHRDLKLLAELMGMTMSKLFEDTIRGYVVTARATGVLNRKKMSKLDMVRFFSEGAKLNPLT